VSTVCLYVILLLLCKWFVIILYALCICVGVHECVFLCVVSVVNVCLYCEYAFVVSVYIVHMCVLIVYIERMCVLSVYIVCMCGECLY